MHYFPLRKPIAAYFVCFFLLQGAALAAGGAEEPENKKKSPRNALLRQQEQPAPALTGILNLDKQLLANASALQTAPASDDISAVDAIGFIAGAVGFTMLLISLAAYGASDVWTSAPGIISLVLMALSGAHWCLSV